MKKTSALWMTGIFLLFLNLKTFAQNAKDSAINPARLTITYNKTTNLIFPYPIKSVDKGSRDILIQKAIGVENVLQLKAAKVGFDETNLTVITSDGSLYSYVLNYALIPTGINLKASNPQVTPKPDAVFSEDATTDKIRLNAEKVIAKKRSFSGSGDSMDGIAIDVKGIYLQDDVCYMQLFLQNKSVVNYDVKMLRFYVTDKKRSKRTASQEIEIEPLFILGNARLIRNNSDQTIVIAVPKFTIPEKKRFEVHMLEAGGGRNLSIRLNNKAIMKARIIN